MKVKCACYQKITKEHFVLYMIVPLFLGLLITLISAAQADWNKKDDPCLLQSPQQQGWEQIRDQGSSSLTIRQNHPKI